MGKILYFRLGERDRISVSQLVHSVQNILWILEDLDASISQKKSGNIRWEVAMLSTNTPPVIGIEGFPVSIKRPDKTQDVYREVLNGIEMLSQKAERSSCYSDSVLTRLRRLALQSKSIGPLTAYSSNGDAEKKKESKINESTLTNIEELIGVKYMGFGSVSGNLDVISVHKRHEFRIWDERTGKPVTCFFDPEMLDDVKAKLKQKVLVYGEISSNRRGEPISAMVKGIELKKLPHTLPTIEEMSGLVQDMYEGKTLKEYLEEIGDE
jgi:hypothetical protein